MKKNSFVIIGETDSRRVQLFIDALAKRGADEPKVVSYLELISGSKKLHELIVPGDIVRIESPGKDFEVERALLRLGISASESECEPPSANECEPLNNLKRRGNERILGTSESERRCDNRSLGTSESERRCDNRSLGAQASSLLRLPAEQALTFLTEQQIDELSFDRGLILPQSQWYCGWCSILKLISEQLAKSPPHIVMNSPEEIAILFDKEQCQAVLEAHGIRMPAALGSISSFAALVELMETKKCHRVFLKPAHGSSASGIVAYEFSMNRHRAISTVEMVASDCEIKLYNSRKVRTYTSYEEIKTLVDALCAHNLFVQKWYPKASINKKVFDLRVVVVSGKSRHVVVRESKTPFTNLHLLNARGQLSVVQEALGEERFAEVLRTCEKAARAFPNCLYVGVDVLISSDFRNHAVAEVNAFGDLLPGILCDGVSTYEAELDAMNDTKLSGVLYV